MIEFNIPIRTAPGLNAREHWRKRQARAGIERRGAKMLCPSGIQAPCVITLTRVSPGTRPMDDDNLPGALKAIRDGIADRIGIDDGDPRLTWRYAQRKGPWGVEVCIVSEGV
ncbi:MAG: hypothetical protein EPN60_16960 [Nevskiaceae bacterium]|nr:MAG: hypothetical protein EPN60_16960 [Nevskiaceae bacterium]